MPVKGGYLLITGGGALLIWSGLKGKSWSTVFRDLISGQSPQAALTAYPVTGSATGPGGTSSAPGPVGGNAAKNRAIGRVLAAPYGWSTGAQWAALDEIWGTLESGWNNHARNPTSGAYGIPQALPPSKMGALANPPISSASAQIAWGLRYIKQRYGNPVNALAFHRANGWY
jgi:hypothetical protein